MRKRGSNYTDPETLESTYDESYSKSPKKRKRTCSKKLTIWSILCSLTVLYLILSQGCVHAVMEFLNYRVKHNSLHAPFNKAAEVSTRLPVLPSKDDKIFYVHVPRTSGNSLRHHLFYLKNQSLLYDFSRNWRTHSPNHWVIAPPFNTEFLHKMSKYYVNKGRMAYQYITQYKQLYPTHNMRTFTLLRHPIERVLSFYKYLEIQHWKEYHFGFEQGMSIEAFMSSNHTKRYSLVENGMTWQFGDYLQYEDRTRTSDDMDSVYEDAIKALEAIDFVAFYEDMIHDFPTLHTSFFGNVTGNELHRFVHRVGTYLFYGRERVLKYSCLFNEDELMTVINHNLYDLRLYQHALKLWNKTFSFYTSYPHLIGNEMLFVNHGCPQIAANKTIREYLIMQ